MGDDDTALAEVDKWIRDNQEFAAKGAGESKADLNKRILARLDVVRKRYQDFLKRNPDSARGHLAYGTFLDDIGDENLAISEFETARKLDPSDPAAWTNCANYYGEHGPITNAFVYYAKAIELNSNEPVYYQNLATTVYLFRKDAREFYNIDEPHVFDKSLALYQKAMQLDPTNFALATDYAESYYGIRPLRTNDALVSWTNALKIAENDMEREAVHIHLARIKIAVGRYAEAQSHLDAVTNATYEKLKSRLQHNLDAALHPETATNSVVTTNTVAGTNAIAPTNPVAATNSTPAQK
ncbi:MAG TPA: hypothetical protein VHQ01_08535 [Pyrinomonadaceae bacterium]|nr:hypothetical protein [Pyrinomonadaceae bacterium]